MEAKILKPFWDLRMRVMREKGQIVKFSDERFAEINEKLGDGYIEAVSPAVTGEKKKSKKKSR